MVTKVCDFFLPSSNQFTDGDFPYSSALRVDSNLIGREQFVLDSIKRKSMKQCDYTGQRENDQKLTKIIVTNVTSPNPNERTTASPTKKAAQSESISNSIVELESDPEFSKVNLVESNLNWVRPPNLRICNSIQSLNDTEFETELNSNSSPNKALI